MYSGQVSDRDRQVMAVLADTPFADVDEVGVFAALQARRVRESLAWCRRNELADYIECSRSTATRTRRWFLTGQGIESLSESEGVTLGRLLRDKPVSVEWQRSLLRRLDTLDLFYRLLVMVAQLDGAMPEWVWYRTSVYDAAFRLRSNGKAFVLMRFGTTLSWQATKSRIGTLYSQQGERKAPTALIVVPTEIEAVRISKFMARRAINFYLIAEDALNGMQLEDTAWWMVGDGAATATLEQTLGDTRTRRRMPLVQVNRNDKLPGNNIRERINAAYLLASEMKAQEKRILRLLYDWPLIKNEHLAEMLGMSSDLVLKKPRAALIGRGFVHVVQIGESHKERVKNGYRSALSDTGRRILVWTDRRRQADIGRHWRIAPDSEGHPKPRIKDYRLDGTKLRMLARELPHTDGASEFTAMLVSDADRQSNYEFVSALPPHRWDRTFRFNGKRSVIRPDATYVVRYQGNRDVYLLEYEKRGSIPARMKPKVEGYRKYYGSMETRVDFGRRRPRTLFVFEDAAQAGRFVSVVRRGMRNENPLFVSSMDVLREQGIFGNAWLYPWDLDLGRVQFAMFRGVRRGS